MRSLFGRRRHCPSRRRRSGTDAAGDRSMYPKVRVERLSRLLVYLFTSKSREESPSIPSPTNIHVQPATTSTFQPQPRLSAVPVQRPSQRLTRRRPHTAPAPASPGVVNMHIHHRNSHSHSATSPDVPLDILLPEGTVILRGTGVDIENGVVRGTVRLSLLEATDIRAVEIRCMGRSRVSVMLNDG